MTKTQLKHLQELDIFLKNRKIKLTGNDIALIFNAHKYNGHNEEVVYVDLNIGVERGECSDIREVEKSPSPTKHHYYIQKGKLKSYC